MIESFAFVLGRFQYGLTYINAPNTPGSTINNKYEADPISHDPTEESTNCQLSLVSSLVIKLLIHLPPACFPPPRTLQMLKVKVQRMYCPPAFLRI